IGRGLCRGKGKNLGVARLFKKKNKKSVCGRSVTIVICDLLLSLGLWKKAARNSFSEQLDVWKVVGVREMVFFFFFSSRRRHTRLTCDWSSDVCSSDLNRRCVWIHLGNKRPERGQSADRGGR